MTRILPLRKRAAALLGATALISLGAGAAAQTSASTGLSGIFAPTTAPSTQPVTQPAGAGDTPAAPGGATTIPGGLPSTGTPASQQDELRRQIEALSPEIRTLFKGEIDALLAGQSSQSIGGTGASFDLGSLLQSGMLGSGGSVAERIIRWIFEQLMGVGNQKPISLDQTLGLLSSAGQSVMYQGPLPDRRTTTQLARLAQSRRSVTMILTGASEAQAQALRRAGITVQLMGQGDPATSMLVIDRRVTIKNPLTTPVVIRSQLLSILGFSGLQSLGQLPKFTDLPIPGVPASGGNP